LNSLDRVASMKKTTVLAKSQNHRALARRHTGQNQPKPAKPQRIIVPPPQSARIIQRFIAGESVRSIAKVERRDRATVTRIVGGDEVKEIVQLMRSQVYSMAGDAIAAVRHGLQQQKDWRLGYRLLVDLGGIPCPAETQSIALQVMQPEPEELTPYERAAAQDETGQVNPIQLALVRVAEMKSEAYGFSMPTLDEMWRNRTVAALINEMTGGRTLSISLSDSVELNRLKKLAEDVLGGKRSMTDAEIVAVWKKYYD